MAKERNYIEEILGKKKRLYSSSRWGQVRARVWRLSRSLDLLDQLTAGSELIELVEANEDALPGQLSNFLVYYRDVRHEIARYIPIGFVACIEGYFRISYADLINYGPPFRDNAAKFDNIKFGIDTAVALQRHSLSLGDFVAHLLPVNNLDDINATMSKIIGSDFLLRYRELRPKLEIQLSLLDIDPNEITDERIAALKDLFDLRHTFVHEADPQTAADPATIWSVAQAAVEFLWVSEHIVSQCLGEGP